MSTVLVTGGTGTFGRLVVPILAGAGHQVRVLSRRPGMGTHLGNLATGAGLAEAAEGAELVVHAASDRLVGRSDPEQTRRLLAAVPHCRHLVYLSIVGVDAIPFRYYRNKLACEQIIGKSSIPSTVLRSTQFHELLAAVLRAVSRLPVALLPMTWRFQSIAAAEVAVRVAELLDAPAIGRALDFGGPQVLRARNVLDVWRSTHPWPRGVIGIRWPGAVYRGFAAGGNTCPANRDGRQTWASFIAGGVADH